LLTWSLTKLAIGKKKRASHWYWQRLTTKREDKSHLKTKHLFLHIIIICLITREH
jgi:hypothetical protein